MGLNYYLLADVCPTCRREREKLHLGKSSYGWTFSFRGYRNDPDKPPIASYQEYLDFLASELQHPGSRIVDEDGREVTLEEFKSLVESKRDSKLNHTLWCRASSDAGVREHGIRECWLDEEGNSFSGGEFS